jgi:hypothetical protein
MLCFPHTLLTPALTLPLLLPLQLLEKINSGLEPSFGVKQLER